MLDTVICEERLRAYSELSLSDGRLDGSNVVYTDSFAEIIASTA